MKWFRDGVELKESTKYEMRREGFSRTLIVRSTESKDSGTYSCQTADDKLEFKVQVKGKSFHCLDNTQIFLYGLSPEPCFHIYLLSFYFRGTLEICRPFEICCSGVGRYT